MSILYVTSYLYSSVMPITYVPSCMYHPTWPSFSVRSMLYCLSFYILYALFFPSSFFRHMFPLCSVVPILCSVGCSFLSMLNPVCPVRPVMSILNPPSSLFYSFITAYLIFPVLYVPYVLSCRHYMLCPVYPVCLVLSTLYAPC